MSFQGRKAILAGTFAVISLPAGNYSRGRDGVMLSARRMRSRLRQSATLQGNETGAQRYSLGSLPGETVYDTWFYEEAIAP